MALLILLDLEVEAGQYDNKFQYRYVDKEDVDKKIPVKKMVAIAQSLLERKYEKGKGLPSIGGEQAQSKHFISALPVPRYAPDG
jgi:hypothetical protein